MKTKTKTFSNEEDFKYFISLLNSKNIKYIIVHHRTPDNAFYFYSLAYGEDPKLEHLLRGEIIARVGNWMLTNKDEFVQAPYGAWQILYYYLHTIPGTTKLYEFLTGDSIDKTKNYKFSEHYQYSLVFNFIPEIGIWFDIKRRKNWIYLKCKSSIASKYITIDPLKL